MGQQTGNHFRSPGIRKGNLETSEGRVSLDSYFESVTCPPQEYSWSLSIEIISVSGF